MEPEHDSAAGAGAAVSWGNCTMPEVSLPLSLARVLQAEAASALARWVDGRRSSMRLVRLNCVAAAAARRDGGEEGGPEEGEGGRVTRSLARSTNH